MAWTVPRRTVISMSLFATTPGKRLVMPRSSTAGACELPVPTCAMAESVMVHTPRSGSPHCERPAGQGNAKARVETLPRPPGPRVNPSGSRLGRNLDLAVDDLLLVAVQLGLDVIDQATGGGVVDAAGLEVEDLLAGLELVVLHVGDEGEDGDVDLLDHRGEDDALDVGRSGEGLVGVDTDGQLARSLGGGEDTATGATGRVVDHVGAVLVHALGRGLALGRVTEAGEVRRLREVLDLDLDVGVDRLGAGDVRRVHDRELGVGVGLGDLGNGRGVGEADGDDVVVAGVDELLETLLAGGLGLTLGGLGLLGVHAEVLLGLVEAGGGGVVERLVATATHVVGHADLDLGGATARRGTARGGVAAVAAGGQSHRCDRHGGRDLDHPTQGVLLLDICGCSGEARQRADGPSRPPFRGAGHAPRRESPRLYPQPDGGVCQLPEPVSQLLRHRYMALRALTSGDASAAPASRAAPTAMAPSSTTRSPWCRS